MSRPRISRVAVLAGTGAFLLTFAALLRFFVYEGVLTLPLEQDRTYRLESPAATFFDTGTLVSRDQVRLVSTTTLSGDVAAGNGNVAVWTEFTSLTTASGERVDYHERRTAFDRRTAMAVDCCAGYVDDDSGAPQTGLAFRLPPRAQPRAYPMYDTVLRRPVPLLFEREDEVQGLRTYRYAYRAGPVKIEDTPVTIPGTLLGLPGARAVPVSRYAQVSRTLWVEPESGLTVRAEERHSQELRTLDGRGRLVSLRADLVTPLREVAGKVADARAFTRWVLVVRDVLPGLFLAAGLLLLVAAASPLGRLRRAGSASGDRPAAEPGAGADRTGPGSGTGSGPDPDPDPDRDRDRDRDSDSDRDRDPDRDPDPDPDPDRGPGPDLGPDPGSGTLPERVAREGT
ncbi:hypothetical protein GCM10010517_57070 [Streptosporangium fragile]|uniref:DUF3068 domain-containing protein n=1 Tax=Streptosporangium fragile TaxID=46186 RepID=A0ABN3W4U4_9ACTN